MDMETDEGGISGIPPSTAPSTLFLWALLGKDGFKRDKVQLDLNSLSLNQLKEAASSKLGLKSPDEIDILYNGKKLTSDEAVASANIKPMMVISAVRRNPPVEAAPSSKNLSGQITQVALALRTAFFNPSFIPMIEKLGQSDMLENIFAIAPGLKDDLVAVAIIQDPAMIFHLSDVESLKKLSTTKPWIVEAFNFLAASVHQEKGAGRTNRPPGSHLFSNQSIFEGDDDDDEDMDDDGEMEGAGPSRITREQLSAALNSLSALGRGALSSVPGQAPAGGQGSGAGLLDFIARATGQGQASSGTSSGPPPATESRSGQNLAGMAGQGAAGGSGMPLTADLVARAMAEALGRLPESQRNDQFNAFRNLASQIQQHNAPAQPAPVPPSTPAPAQPSTALGNPLAAQYRDQLAQMREMGINDENLSILALRVSDGDVGTAVELIFSGWTGEGSDSQMED